ncbi:NAD(+) synthase [Hallella multisaccharivorax DSM 17128]|uniref:Glutamine-dependent NAD(+) synthetase n=1 Tax=Hallella multisaccharivorax DSM 17128 TaxID=688246 RepID=F8NBP1_9BACT|nr:NAD(+) synthase [Hallella multisaccharivorax]EGN58003.1 NH(3)-dependent NAD(+) synthetase [Hallella multisaccharivorax DSM 17128]GJG30719.1 NAD(+) synthase [Hallella multisaccharivorax DSM 17128]
MKYGIIKVATAVPTVKVADCVSNIKEIESLVVQAEGQGVEIIVFPELSVTGYTCQDLFRQQLLLDATENCVMQLLEFSRQLDIISIVGVPMAVGNLLLNCAIVIQRGKILGIVPKTFLPNYNEFYEKRWFASSQDLRDQDLRYAGHPVSITAAPQLFRTGDGILFGVEICEDVWAPTPPSNHLALAGADIIFNLSASDELIGKHDYLKDLLAQQSARTICGYVYSGAGFGESTQDVVYGGNALVYENGRLLAEGERFALKSQLVSAQIDVERLRGDRRGNTTFVNAQRRMMNEDIRISRAESAAMPHDFVLERKVNPHPFIPTNTNMQKSCEEIFNIQVMGLAKRILHTHAKTVVVGISGGLDSTLALLVCVKTFDKLKLDRKGIVGVTMPGFGTTGRTHNNAVSLMQSLGVDMREVNISKSVLQHFEDIGQNPDAHDVTYENAQARERTQILMDLANKLGGLVIGTGDLSELALGWATYNGDHMSMYAVNTSIPKTLIQYLVKFVAQTVDDESASTLYDIIATPISPELIPAGSDGSIQQKTEDLVGPYELHDFFLYHFLRNGFGPRKIFVLAKRAFGESLPPVEGVGRYDDETILHWLKTFCRRFFNQQFKRSCLPDGPKVGSVSLSPRGDWRMPTDAVVTLWLDEVEKLMPKKIDGEG